MEPNRLKNEARPNAIRQAGDSLQPTTAMGPAGKSDAKPGYVLIGVVAVLVGLALAIGDVWVHWSPLAVLVAALGLAGLAERWIRPRIGRSRAHPSAYQQLSDEGRRATQQTGTAARQTLALGLMLAIAILWLLVGLVAAFVLGAMLEQLGPTAQLVGGLAAAIGVPIVGSILTVRMLRVRVPG